jgi:radical SAM C-methyltransferase
MLRKKMWLAQQAVWDIEATGHESMPLACAFLKAAAAADERIASEADLRIFNFGGADTTLSVTRRMLLAGAPDMAAFSIFGWNYHLFGRVTETYRQMRPDGLVVFGGTHVTNQAERVFRQYPAVDVVVNGEGEITFRELVTAHLEGRAPHDLGHIRGISYRDPDGRVVTTPDRPIVQTLDDLPSPFLSGAMELTKPNGDFRYDVALMETARGCPYKCAFCFWGGAIGQKIRAFSTDRLREEIDLFARHKVASIVLCDANFGMTKTDEEFLEILIKARERHGYPRHVITSWAKNKGKVFYGMVRRMKETGFHSSFTLALQSLADPALAEMNRKNMKVNEWRDLAAWLHKEGIDLYAEVLWGCPGETVDSFLEGYDALAATVTRIAAYPLLVLPNTDYDKRRDDHGFVTWRCGNDDFEYVLAHKTMTVEDNRRMHRFLYWARVIGEYMLFRYIWAPLGKLAGVTHSQVFLGFDAWLDAQDDPVAAHLRACRAQVVDRFDAYKIEAGLHAFYREPGVGVLMARWWEEDVIPRVPAVLADFFRDLFRYDWSTRPLWRTPKPGDREANAPWSIVECEGDEYFVGPPLQCKYRVPDIVRCIIRDEPCDVQPAPHEVVLHYRVGFGDYVSNHEFYPTFVGKTRDELREEARQRQAQAGANGSRPGDVAASAA